LISKLSEKLIEAIRKMKCPYPLQAQQIQGLDYINLFPIIQWLIKKVIETREETGDLVRMYSESQFKKSFKMPQDVDFDTRKPTAVAYANSLEDRYRPLRRYKRQKTSAPTVNSTLLEYGKLNRMSRAQPQEKRPQSDNAKKIGAALGASAGTDEDEAAAEEKRIQQMMKNLDTVSGGAKITGVGDLISADQIQQIASQISEEGGAGPTGAGQKNLAEKQHKQTVARLEKQIEQQKGTYLKVKEDYVKHGKRVNEIQDELATKTEESEKIVAEIKKLDALENPQNAKQLETLRSLIGLNESLRAQEALFKANCKKQMQQFQELIEAMQKDQGVSEDAERATMIEEAFTSHTAKLKKIQQLAAKKNRDIALIERKIDEVPSRTELVQYQRQFVDLYEQVSSRLTETRQYYISYNTLEDTRSVIAREVSILNSIHDNYKTAMSTKQNREKFIESLDGIIKSVAQNYEKEETKQGREKKNFDELNQRYLKLVEKERNFYKETKEFQEECKKNEKLLALLAK